MNTCYLNTQSWDLVLDSSGNIAMAGEPYAQAQDAASAIKTFLGECYFDTTLGVPYEWQILGNNPSLEFIRAQFISEAMTVPGVLAARVFFTSFKDRTLTGQVQITNSKAIMTAMNF
jgi:hypothetical protein